MIASVIHLQGNADFMFSNTELEVFLKLPFLVGDILVGVTSLGDRPDSYLEREVKLFAPLCEIGGLLIVIHRNR